jgi:hypothetical protein
LRQSGARAEFGAKGNVRGQHDHVLERNATLKALRAPETLRGITYRAAPAFVQAVQGMAADFPECDFRKLRLNTYISPSFR